MEKKEIKENEKEEIGEEDDREQNIDKKKKGDNTTSKKKEGTSKEKDEIKEVGKENVDLMKIMIQLENLRNILIKGHTIIIGETCYNAKNSNTYEIKCKFIEVNKGFLELIKIGDNQNPYLLKHSRYPLTFTEYDEMINKKWSVFDIILEEISCIMLEPDRELTPKGEIYNPVKVGLPISLIENINVEEGMVLDVLYTMLRPINKMSSIYFTKMNIVIDRDISILMNRFFNTVKIGMPMLRMKFIEYWKHTLNNNFPKKVPQEVGPLILMRPICDPFYLNLAFRDIPLSGTFCFGLTTETLMPEIPLEPIPPTLITGASGVSVVRASIVTPFNSISFDTSWNESLLAYFGSYLMPSFIEMSINMDDIDENSPLYFLALISSKLLFMFNENDSDWNNITNTSVEWIDAKIITFLCDVGIIASIDTRNTRRNPSFEMFAPTANRGKNIVHWSDIFRTQDGGGWQNDGYKRYGMNDIGKKAYPFCMPRQIYVNDTDTRNEKDEDSYINRVHSWKIYVVLKEICIAVQQNNAAFNGILTIFNICAKRIFSFFSELNIFTNRRWYTGMKLPDKAHRFQKLAEDERIIQISGRAIIYILKSIHGDKPLDCATSYDEQFRIESNLAFEINKFRIGVEHIDREINIIGIPRNEYKKNDIYRKAMLEKGPFSQHLRLLDGMRLLGNIGTLNFDNREEGLISLMEDV